MPYNPKSLLNLVNVNGRKRRLNTKLRVNIVGNHQTLKEVEEAMTDIASNMAKPVRDAVQDKYFELIYESVERRLEAGNAMSGYPHELDPPKDRTILESITHTKKGDTVVITYGEGLEAAKYAAYYNAPEGKEFDIYPTHGAFLKFPNRIDLPNYGEYIYARSVTKHGHALFDNSVAEANAQIDDIIEEAVEEFRYDTETEDIGVSRGGARYRKFAGAKSRSRGI